MPGFGSRGLKTHLSRSCFRSMWRPLVASGDTKTRRTIIDVTWWLKENLRLVVRLPALASSAWDLNCHSGGIAARPPYLHNRTYLTVYHARGSPGRAVCQLVTAAVFCLKRVQEISPCMKDALEWGPARTTTPDPPAVPRTVPQAVYRQEL